MLFKVCLFTAFLLAIFHFSSGAFKIQQCYECEYFEHEMADNNKDNNEKCKNDLQKDMLVNCSDKAPTVTEFQCIKVTGRIEVDEENYNYYKRACSPGKNYDTCKDCKDTQSYETQYGFVKRGKHCVCDNKDGCNSASGLVISTLTVAIGLLLATVINS